MQSYLANFDFFIYLFIINFKILLNNFNFFFFFEELAILFYKEISETKLYSI